MKPKQMMLFAVAIGCGLVAMIGAQQILSGNKTPDVEMVDILVSKADIEPGIPLDKYNVGMRKWPKDQVAAGAITTEEEWVDHAPIIHLAPNMPILTTYLGAKGAAGVNSLIPDGMEVVTIPVNSAQAHSGLLRAGSYVKIDCTIEREQRDVNRPKSTEVKTVLKRVKVIAVGDQVAGTEEAKKENNSPKVENVSFVTYPLQAKLLHLAFAVSKGQIHISMLPEGSKSNDDTRDLDDADLAKRSHDLQGLRQLDPENDIKKLLAAAPTNERPKGSSFSDYLKQQPVTSGVADLGKEPSRATWRIEIYKGDKKEIHEVELPKDTKETTSALQSTPVNDSDWAAPIIKFFSRKPPKTNEVQEAQSTLTEEEPSEAPGEKNAENPVPTSRQ